MAGEKSNAVYVQLLISSTESTADDIPKLRKTIIKKITINCSFLKELPISFANASILASTIFPSKITSPPELQI